MRIDTASLRLGTTKLGADLEQVLTGLTLDGSSDSVAQLTITASDLNGTVAKSTLAVPGTPVTWMGDGWQVAAITSTWGADDTIIHSFDCRSTLARRLRRTYKASAEKKVSPSAWVASRVQSAGGIAVCQPSAKQGTIAQSSGSDRQSELDVISNLAGDQQFSWCEWGGRLWFGSRYWAWQGHATGQRLWPVTRHASPTSDAISVEITQDSDVTDNYATGTLTVPYGYGVKVRPWDRVDLAGHGRRNGIYLVDGVNITADGFSPVTLTLAQPHPPTKKKGSTT